DPGQHLLLAQRNAELLIGLEDFRIDLVERGRAGHLLRRRVVVDVLVVDLRVLDPCPGRLALGEPVARGFEPPLEHPLGLVLLARDETHRVFGETLRGLLRFDQRLESVFVLVDIDQADPIDRLLHGRHSSLRCGFKARGLDGARYGLVRVSNLTFASNPVQAARPPLPPLNKRETSFLQAIRTVSISVSVVFRPMLNRTATAASAGAIPMALSTWEAATLPEEHAEPDEAAIPARSRAIRAVSAFRPGTANRVVLGSRSAPAPKITVSGATSRNP